MAERFFGASGYVGGRSDRKSMQQWQPFGGSASSDHLPQQDSLRSRSRDLARNSPIASGAIRTNVTAIVGTGLRVQSQIDTDLLGLSDEQAEAWQREAERIWSFAKDRLDIEGELTYAAQQGLVLRSKLESGDVLVLMRFKPSAGDLFGTKIQLIESDRISNPNNQMDTDRVVGGVEFDEDGRTIGYHVRNRHPGELFGIHRGGDTWSMIPAWGPNGVRLSKLLYEKQRPGQRRGVPYLAPVIEPLKQLERYTESELMAAVVASFFTVFVKTEMGDTGLAKAPGGEEAPADEDSGDLFMNPGAVLSLAPGEDIETANPSRPNADFEPFFLAIMRQVGVGLEMPFEVLMKHFQSSYSAAQAALLEAWRAFKVGRSGLAAEFCQFSYEAVITEAVARGTLPAPGFFDNPVIQRAWLATSWSGDPPGMIDQVKGVQAAAKRVELGVSTLSIETAELSGQDWETLNRQRAKEVRIRRESGLESDPEEAVA